MIDRILRKAESVNTVDRPAATLARRTRALLDGRTLDRALRGSGIGHPAHPPLAILPIGAWVSSAVLDVIGQRTAARHLVAMGSLTAPVAAVAGLAEFSRLSTVQRRVGALHLAANIVAGTCYLTSHRCRTRGAHRAGMAWGLLGLVAVAAGGALGGHLSYALGAGVYEWRSEPEPAH